MIQDSFDPVYFTNSHKMKHKRTGEIINMTMKYKEVIENMTQFRIDENMINMMNQHNQNGCETSSDEDLNSISSIEGSLKGISSKLALAYDHDENCKIDDPKIINTTTNNKFNHSSSTPLIYLYPNLGNHNNHNNNSHSHNNHNSYINLYLKLK